MRRKRKRSREVWSEEDKKEGRKRRRRREGWSKEEEKKEQGGVL